jgi:hypothetical protein
MKMFCEILCCGSGDGQNYTVCPKHFWGHTVTRWWRGSLHHYYKVPRSSDSSNTQEFLYIRGPTQGVTCPQTCFRQISSDLMLHSLPKAEWHFWTMQPSPFSASKSNSSKWTLCLLLIRLAYSFSSTFCLYVKELTPEYTPGDVTLCWMFCPLCENVTVGLLDTILSALPVINSHSLCLWITTHSPTATSTDWLTLQYNWWTCWGQRFCYAWSLYRSCGYIKGQRLLAYL